MRILVCLLVACIVIGCNNRKSESGSAGTPIGPMTDNSVTVSLWNDVTSDLLEFKASFPRNFPITHRPYAGVQPPVPISQVTDFSAEKVDKNGNLTHCFKIVAGRHGGGSKKVKVNEALEEMLWDGQLVRREAKRSEPKNVMWGGLSAVETVFTLEESPQFKAHRTIIRQLATEKVVYIGVIRNPGDITVDEENRFWNSFKIQPQLRKN